MLELRANFNGVQRDAIGQVQKFERAYPSAVRRGLSRIVRGMHRVAMQKLSGPGSKGITTERISRNGTRYLKWQKRDTPIAAGGYPVPVRTGTLRRLLDFVEPGRSKSGAGFSIHAGRMQATLFNSAEYSNVIHEGLGSSAKYGPRRYLVDALEQYKQGEMAAILEEELSATI